MTFRKLLKILEVY